MMTGLEGMKKTTFCIVIYFFNFRCCLFTREVEESDLISPVVVLSISGISGMAAVLSSMKRKDTPPPPYEDPPSYEVAIQMEENEEKTRI